MRIELNFKSGVPTYLQIVEQVKYAAASGVLRAGEGLPSIRILAERLRINRNTVAKAYTELERQGAIEVIQGKGAFVTDKASPLRKSVRDSLITETIDAVLVQAHHLQISQDELLEIFQQRLEKFTPVTPKSEENHE